MKFLTKQIIALIFILIGCEIKSNDILKDIVKRNDLIQKESTESNKSYLEIPIKDKIFCAKVKINKKFKKIMGSYALEVVDRSCIEIYEKSKNSYIVCTIYLSEKPISVEKFLVLPNNDFLIFGFVDKNQLFIIHYNKDGSFNQLLNKFDLDYGNEIRSITQLEIEDGAIKFEMETNKCLSSFSIT